MTIYEVETGSGSLLYRGESRAKVEGYLDRFTDARVTSDPDCYFTRTRRFLRRLARFLRSLLRLLHGFRQD